MPGSHTAPRTLHIGRVRGYSMSLGRYLQANDLSGLGTYRRSRARLIAATEQQFGAFPTPAEPLPAIPHRPDGRPRPARAKAATIIMTAKKARSTEVIPTAVVPIAWRSVRTVADRSPRTVDRNVVVGRLMIARQEAVAVPVIGVSLLNRRRERDCRQQQQQNGARCGDYARHERSIHGTQFKCDTPVELRFQAITLGSDTAVAFDAAGPPTLSVFASLP